MQATASLLTTRFKKLSTWIDDEPVLDRCLANNMPALPPSMSAYQLDQ